MGNLGGSLLLLLVALLLLYLAVTDRLSRLLDAKDVITGAKQVSSSGGASAVTNPSPVVLSLPSLPSIGINAQVQA